MEILDVVRAHVDAAGVHRHRCVLVLTGPREAVAGRAHSLVTALQCRDVRWFSDSAPPGISPLGSDTALQLLGGEIGALVFDAWAGFDPDAFGALTGCIRAGGLLILLAPPLEDWPAYADPQHARITVAPYPPEQVKGRFLGRLARVIADETSLILVNNTRLVRQSPLTTGAVSACEPLTGPCKTLDQQQAVAALLKVATGHRRRPVVLVSDRGRGKSAAFGIAAAQLAGQGRERILLTAARANAVAAVFEQAERIRPGARRYLHFMAPDEMAENPPEADLLLVDEAAAIPVPILEKLLRRYPRIAFASTVHGYEGTGRGFALRFSTMLDALSNSWKTLTLKTPIRWAPGDPLERLVFRMLALDAEPADSGSFGGAGRPEDFELFRLQRDTLAADERTLAEVFGLLVQAHYRTRPLDLRHLLDGPNLSVYVMRAAGHVAATALVAAEGGFDRDTADAIWSGESRPHGHLLPETLSAHQGLRQAPLLRCGRVMRVAVHPALQRRGLGSRMLPAIVAQLVAEGCDYVGTSFGATPGLVDFWQRLGWLPVRLSIQKGASSGTHSAVMLQPLSDAGEALLAQARQRYYAQFPHQLSDSLRGLEPALVAALLAHGGDRAPQLDEADRQDLRAFAHARRLAEVSIGSLWRLALRALMLGHSDCLEERELAVLVVRVMQKHSWREAARGGGFSGRKQALQSLRAAVGKLIQ
jgi:tRNA(Met) cytidine acetyltransferase